MSPTATIPRVYAKLVLAGAGLALVVVMLGAYVRLSDAGLGCPDWPGCYGRLLVPGGEEARVAAAQFPERPLHVAKAWKEMAHRYAAGVLGALIALLAGIAWWRRRELPVGLPSALLALVIFQALLGMWTVTLLLKPAVVVAHLLGGFATLSLLWLLWLRRAAPPPAVLQSPGLRGLALLGLAALLAQIALGGWTSSNYAALACVDFPTCRQSWWPVDMRFGEAFVLWRGLGIDYENGVLGDQARVAIHVAHRLGAVLTALLLAALAITAIAVRPTRAIMRAGWAMLGLLGAQLALGVGNVVLSLPLAVATAHNGVAALLLLSSITLLHLLYPAPSVRRVSYPAAARRHTPSGLDFES